MDIDFDHSSEKSAHSPEIQLANMTEREKKLLAYEAEVMSDPYYFGRRPPKTNGGVNKDTFDPTCQDMRENMKQCASAEENTIVDTIISLKARISSNCYDYDAHVSLIETLQHLTANGDSMIIDQMMAVINQEVGDNQASESSALECREIGQAQRTPRFPPPPNSDLSENMTVVDETKQIVQAHSFDASGFTGPMGVCLLRAAREHMANYFPLTEDLWADWLHDEMSAEQPNQSYVTSLFERAVIDYQSVRIWLEYCQYRMDVMTNRAEITTIRELFERSTVISGLHFVEGSSIWEGYREFELTIYQSYMNMQVEQPSQETEKQIVNQINRITNLYHRQLAIPHMSLHATKESYDSWCKQHGISFPNVETAYQMISGQVNEYLSYESVLVETDSSYESFLKYIEFEKSLGVPERVVSIYERTIIKYCLIEQLWLDYIKYLWNSVYDFEFRKLVHQRSLRNVPLSSRLYISYMETLELFHQPFQVIEDLYTVSMKTPFSSFEDQSRIALHFGRLLVRSKSVDTEKIINFYQNCINYYHGTAGENGENKLFMKDLLNIYRYLVKDIERTKEIWQYLLENDTNECCEYLDFIRNYETPKKLRSEFKVCLKKLKNPKRIVEKWLMYENLFGDAESIKAAKDAIEKYGFPDSRDDTKIEANSRGSVKRRKPLVVSDVGAKKWKKKVESTFKRVVQDKLVQNINETNFKRGSSKTRKTQFDECLPYLPEKISNAEHFDKDQSQKTESSQFKNLDPDKLGFIREFSVFISNVDYGCADSAIFKEFEKIGKVEKVYIVRDYKGNSKGYGFVQFSDKETVVKALESDRKFKFGKRACFVSPISLGSTRPTKFKGDINQKLCLYVSKIHLEVKEDELVGIFNQLEGFKECRLATYRNGNSKGFAYVEFIDEESVKKALLKTDGASIRDKTISVHISNPPKIAEKETKRTVVQMDNHEQTRITSQSYSNQDFQKLFKKN